MPQDPDSPTDQPLGQQDQADPPSPLRFVYDLPPLSERKLALIKLVAKYTVIDPTQVASRKDDFLDEHNSLHPLFAAFVAQYTLVKEGAQPLEGDVLSRAIRRAAEPVREPEPPKPTADPLASIDWQDFVVLETVEFFSADLNGTSSLSAPFTLTDLELRKESTTNVSEPVFKSPITGEMVPASQYNEHVRVLTLDPSYNRQKAKEAERAGSNLDMENVVDNIEQLRAKRRKLQESL